MNGKIQASNRILTFSAYAVCHHVLHHVVPQYICPCLAAELHSTHYNTVYFFNHLFLVQI